MNDQQTEEGSERYYPPVKPVKFDELSQRYTMPIIGGFISFLAKFHIRIQVDSVNEGEKTIDLERSIEIKTKGYPENLK